MQTYKPVPSTSTAVDEIKKEEDVALATPRTTRRSTRILHVASPVESPEAEVEESQESGEAGDESFTASMSLDVLAQVATETLEKEPVSKSKVPFFFKLNLEFLWLYIYQDYLNVLKLRTAGGKTRFCAINRSLQGFSFFFLLFFLEKKIMSAGFKFNI